MIVLRYPDLRARKGIVWSRVYLARLEKAGKFPRRIRLGANSVAWDEAEIDAWLEERAAERSEAS